MIIIDEILKLLDLGKEVYNQKGELITQMEPTNVYRADHGVSAGELGALQGDVGIVRIPKLPEGLKRMENNIVALGEVTGHHHILETEAEVYTDAVGNLFALVDQPVKIQHHEHAAITLVPGCYAISQQVEYDGAEERRVLD